MWDLLGPGIEPMSPALAGRFLTTGSPGKSHVSAFKLEIWHENKFLLIHCVAASLPWPWRVKGRKDRFSWRQWKWKSRQGPLYHFYQFLCVLPRPPPTKLHACCVLGELRKQPGRLNSGKSVWARDKLGKNEAGSIQGMGRLGWKAYGKDQPSLNISFCLFLTSRSSTYSKNKIKSTKMGEGNPKQQGQQ